MNQSLLDLPFFDARPNLQGLLKYFFRAFASGTNAGLLAILSLIIGIAIWLNNEAFVVWTLSIYFLAMLVITTYILYLVISSNYLYRIRTYNLNWEIEDISGNTGFFTLEQEIVLRRTTDTISLFFSLDDHVDVMPYNYLPMYYGYRKRFLTYLDSYKQVGTPISIKANGRRNISRKSGNNMIEIPIDFPLDELNVAIKFQKHSEVSVEVYIRNGGISTLIDQNSDECFVANLRSQNGCLVSCKVKEPKFGYSYLILWHAKPDQITSS